jgi:aspartate-semialdehyde dehydrogenase
MAGSRVTIVGASSLLGTEIKTILEERQFPIADLDLLDESIHVGELTEAGGAPAVVQSIASDSFDHRDLVFFAGSLEVVSKHWADARRAGATVIDLTGAFVELEQSVAWIPAIDKLLAQQSSSPQPSDAKLFLSPHSAAIIGCSLAAALQKFHAARIVLMILQPASERGREGIEELENQSIKLLRLEPITSPVYDAQVAFNFLHQFGEGSSVQLAEIRSKIARSMVRYLSGRATPPMVQVIQAPVFYSHAFAAYMDELENSLVSAGMTVRAAGDPSPDNISVAGQNSIHVARVEADESGSGRFWILGAADNIRLAAKNAVSIAEQICAA